MKTKTVKFVISKDGIVYCYCHKLCGKNYTIVTAHQALLGQYIMQRNHDICTAGLKALLTLAEKIRSE